MYRVRNIASYVASCVALVHCAVNQVTYILIKQAKKTPQKAKTKTNKRKKGSMQCPLYIHRE